MGQPFGKKSSAFTIVELLIVIVVIGILAAITVISYIGVQAKANAATINADLNSAFKVLELDYTTNGVYPATLAAANNGGGIKAGGGETLAYTVRNDTINAYCLSATKGGLTYSVGQNGRILAGPCPLLYLDAADKKSYSGSGTTWFDISGNNNDGTLNGGVGYSTVNGGAFTFDGVDDYVSSTTAHAYVDAVIVFEPDLTYTGGFAYLLSSGTSTDEALRFVSVDGSGGWSLPNPGNGNDWSYSTSTSYYINGSLSNNTATSGWDIVGGYRTNQTAFPASFAYYLGTGYTARLFRGKVAAVYLYERALTDTEQKQIFSSLRGNYGL